MKFVTRISDRILFSSRSMSAFPRVCLNEDEVGLDAFLFCRLTTTRCRGCVCLRHVLPAILMRYEVDWLVTPP